MCPSVQCPDGSFAPTLGHFNNFFLKIIDNNIADQCPPPPACQTCPPNSVGAQFDAQEVYVLCVSGSTHRRFLFDRPFCATAQQTLRNFISNENDCYCCGNCSSLQEFTDQGCVDVCRCTRSDLMDVLPGSVYATAVRCNFSQLVAVFRCADGYTLAAHVVGTAQCTCCKLVTDPCANVCDVSSPQASNFQCVFGGAQICFFHALPRRPFCPIGYHAQSNGSCKCCHAGSTSACNTQCGGAPAIVVQQGFVFILCGNCFHRCKQCANVPVQLCGGVQIQRSTGKCLLLLSGDRHMPRWLHSTNTK